jgi:hypothetical protein
VFWLKKKQAKRNRRANLTVWPMQIVRTDMIEATGGRI